MGGKDIESYLVACSVVYSFLLHVCSCVFPDLTGDKFFCHLLSLTSLKFSGTLDVVEMLVDRIINERGNVECSFWDFV